MTNARVLTFHIAPESEADLVRALDVEAAKLAQCPGFGGLLCLKQDGHREHIMVISLWDDEGIATTAAAHERTRQHIAATTDLGVTSQQHKVLRLIPHGSGNDLDVYSFGQDAAAQTPVARSARSA